MQFPVPQFIDVEDQLIGPFSLKQFGFVFVGGLIDLAFYRIFKLSFIFIILALPVTLFTLVMTFGRFNGRRIYDSIPIFLGFLSAPKNLVFQKKSDIDDLHIQTITIEQVNAQQVKDNPVAEEAPQSKLKRLSHLLEQKNAEVDEIVKQSQNER